MGRRGIGVAFGWVAALGAGSAAIRPAHALPAAASPSQVAPAAAAAQASATPPVAAGLGAVPLLGEVAVDTLLAVGIEAPATVAAAWQAFVGAHQQRSLSERVLLRQADVRQQVGIDPLSAQDFSQAGLDLNAGSVLLVHGDARLPNGQRPVVLMARVADPAAARSFAARFAGGLTPPPAQHIGAAEFHPAQAQQTGVWALDGATLYLAAPAAAEAVRHQLSAKATGARLSARAAGPLLRAPAGRQLATVYIPAAMPAPCQQTVGQLAWLSFGGDGLDVRGRNVGPLEPGCPLSFDPPMLSAMAAFAALPASAAAPAWANVQIASARQAAVWFASLAGWGQQVAAGHHPERAQRLGRWRRELASFAAERADVDGPMAAAVGQASGQLQVVARGVAPSPAGLARAGDSLCAQSAVRCRREMVAKAPFRIARPSNEASAWQAGWAGRWALFSNSPPLFAAAMREAAQARLPLLRAPAPSAPGEPSAPLMRASAQLGLWSEQLAREAADDHQKGWLSWFPLPQLLMMGPAGDGLHELSSLGNVELTVWREQSAVIWHLQQRRLR